MIICDECRDINAKAFDVALVIEKQDEYRATASNRRTIKKKPREVVRIPLVICDKCLSAVLKNLGKLKQRGELSGRRGPARLLMPDLSEETPAQLSNGFNALQLTPDAKE